jgi:hypothetical protein
LQARLEHIAGPGNHVPLYFLLVGLLPHQTDLGLRSTGLFWSLLGIALMMRFTHWLYHQREAALIIGAWLAVNPYMVYYARMPDPMPWPLSILPAIFSATTTKSPCGGSIWPNVCADFPDSLVNC